MKNSRRKHSCLCWTLWTLTRQKHAEVDSWIRNLFSFFGQLKTMSPDELNKRWEHLASVSDKVLDYGDIRAPQALHCSRYKKKKWDSSCIIQQTNFGQLEICAIQYWHPSVHVHNDNDQLYRGMLALKSETYKESILQHNESECLNWLPLVCMENDILNTTDFKPTIKLSTKKFCKHLHWLITNNSFCMVC